MESVQVYFTYYWTCGDGCCAERNSHYELIKMPKEVAFDIEKKLIGQEYIEVWETGLNENEFAGYEDVRITDIDIPSDWY